MTWQVQAQGWDSVREDFGPVVLVATGLDWDSADALATSLETNEAWALIAVCEGA